MNLAKKVDIEKATEDLRPRNSLDNEANRVFLEARSLISKIISEEGNRYLFDIELEGCDASTCISMAITEDEITFLKKLQKKVNEKSDGSCMPRLLLNRAKK